MLALGVTGDVGAGKSTLTRFWKEMGASVLDADEIVRSLWKRPESSARRSHGGAGEWRTTAGTSFGEK